MLCGITGTFFKIAATSIYQQHLAGSHGSPVGVHTSNDEERWKAGSLRSPCVRTRISPFGTGPRGVEAGIWGWFESLDRVGTPVSMTTDAQKPHWYQRCTVRAGTNRRFLLPFTHIRSAEKCSRTKRSTSSEHAIPRTDRVSSVSDLYHLAKTSWCLKGDVKTRRDEK